MWNQKQGHQLKSGQSSQDRTEDFWARHSRIVSLNVLLWCMHSYIFYLGFLHGQSIVLRQVLFCWLLRNYMGDFLLPPVAHLEWNQSNYWLYPTDVTRHRLWNFLGQLRAFPFSSGIKGVSIFLPYGISFYNKKYVCMSIINIGDNKSLKHKHIAILLTTLLVFTAQVPTISWFAFTDSVCFPWTCSFYSSLCSFYNTLCFLRPVPFITLYFLSLLGADAMGVKAMHRQVTQG